MLKKMQKNVESYMCNTRVLSESSIFWKDQCYTFGYLDGYFNEQTYLEYIINYQNNTSKLEVYNTGYEKGLKDGKRTKIYDTQQYKKDKQNWIKNLALHDALNSVETRTLKDETKELYEKYKNGTFHLGKMDFVEERDRISKKR